MQRACALHRLRSDAASVAYRYGSPIASDALQRSAAGSVQAFHCDDRLHAETRRALIRMSNPS